MADGRRQVPALPHHEEDNAGLGRLAHGEEAPYKQAVTIRHAVRRLWAKTTYFRISHYERPITPDMQQKIAGIFARLAPGAQPRYDYLTEEYDFS